MLAATVLAAGALPANAQAVDRESRIAAQCLIFNSYVLGDGEGTLSADEEGGLLAAVMFWAGVLSAKVDATTFEELALEELIALIALIEAEDDAAQGRIEEECSAAVAMAADQLDSLATRMDAID